MLEFASLVVSPNMKKKPISCFVKCAGWLCVLCCLCTAAGYGQTSSNSLSLTRPARSWEFLSATGQRAAFLGDESGRLEGWVYPLKVFRGFHLKFLVGGREIPAEALVRTLTVHPESTSLTYASDTFSVRETLCAPVHEAGLFILLDVDTTEPVDIVASFHSDLQLEWPAALGATYMNWNPTERAFILGEEQKKYVALIGSPTGTAPQSEYQTNYSSAQESSFRLGTVQKGHETRVIIVAGSVQNQKDAEGGYQRLSRSYDSLLRESADYYRNYLDRTVQLILPDADLQKAYDWSRVSMVQGIVENPFLGTGLIAGYRTSGESQRPGFAWFFGRDSEWTDLALDAVGDFADTRTALDFLSKFQREDGKVPHEIAQTASLLPWFKDYPFAFASADATPLFIIAVADYVRSSGDVEFAQTKWSSLERAYSFLRSTYDDQGLPRNFGVGHGWIEGGPLLPVETELYQSAVGTEALRALAGLASAVGKTELADKLLKEFASQRVLLNKAFWSKDVNSFIFAIDNAGKQIPVTSVLSTVPMWFGSLDEEQAQATIGELSSANHQTDWGMRIISNQNPKYGPDGYHFGAVWPLFTGWAATGEFRYHKTFPAYANLRANALLAVDGSLGHVTEVLSGDFYQPLITSSPHQIWSAAMVVNPLLRGMLGIDFDALGRHLTFAPHVPAGWKSLSVSNVPAGAAKINLFYERTTSSITFRTKTTGTDSSCTLEFAPALSLRARILKAELNSRPLPFRVQSNAIDQHVSVQVPACSGSNTIVIHVQNDFGLRLDSQLPALGARSEGLRVTSEACTRPDPQYSDPGSYRRCGPALFYGSLRREPTCQSRRRRTHFGGGP